ncbi:MAG TPA: lamin tail domain-containing protein [Flavobacteriales bacterium]|nr:lamin tail domain-containing protein [Flavobacteriales bacterium]
MNKFYTLAGTLMLITGSAFSQCNELFISEYVEGSGNDKAIEIYNPTAAPIDLSTYSIRRFSNGAIDYSAGGSTILTGTLAALDVFVVTNGQTVSQTSSPACSPDLQLLADQLDGAYPAPTYMNGDDAIGLFKGEVMVDLFGKIGEDPGTAWSNEFPYSGDAGAWITSNHTMIRKSAVQTGIATNPEFFDPLAQYDTLPSNTWTNLGTHDCICNTINSVKSIETEASVRVFPNPVLNNELHISSTRVISTISISNMIGQIVFTSKNQGNNSPLMKVTVDELPRGVYYLQINHQDRTTSTQKIVIR